MFVWPLLGVLFPPRAFSQRPVRDQAIPNYSGVMLGEGQALALRLSRGFP